MDIAVKKMPRVALSKRDELPESPGLYFLVDNAGRVYYLAACDRIKSDVLDNPLLKDFLASKAEFIHYFLWQDIEDLSDWENEYLVKLDPPLNRGSDELPVTNLGYSESQFIERYKEINLTIAELEKERDELRPNIVSLIENNGDTIKSNGITAYLNRRTTFEYSTRVSILNQQIKELKKEEEKTGVAIPKSVVVFPVVR
jgi:hypothetical protein